MIWAMDDVAQRLEAFFPSYVEMGDARSLLRVAQQTGVSILTVTQHAKQHGWRERLKAEQRREERVARLPTKKAEVDELNTRQLDLAKTLRRKAEAALETMEFERPTDVLRALDLARDMERQAAGADDAREADLAALLMRKLEELTGKAPVEEVKPADAVIRTEPPPPVSADEFQLDQAFLDDSEANLDDDDQQG